MTTGNVNAPDAIAEYSPTPEISVEVLRHDGAPNLPSGKVRVTFGGVANVLDEYEIHRLMVALAAARRTINPKAEILV